MQRWQGPASEYLSAADRVALFTTYNDARGKPTGLGIGTEFGSDWRSEIVPAPIVGVLVGTVPYACPVNFIGPSPVARDGFQRNFSGSGLSGPWTLSHAPISAMKEASVAPR